MRAGKHPHGCRFDGAGCVHDEADDHAPLDPGFAQDLGMDGDETRAVHQGWGRAGTVGRHWFSGLLRVEAEGGEEQEQNKRAAEAHTNLSEMSVHC
jgi:hypothetical protein